MWFKEWWAVVSFLIIGVFIGYILDTAELTANVVQEPNVDENDFNVIKAESFTWMGSSILNARTAGKFVKVSLDIHTDTRYTAQLQDSEGRLYDRMPDDDMYLENAIVTPGITAGAMVFEIPADATGLSLKMMGRIIPLAIIDIGIDESNEQEFQESE